MTHCGVILYSEILCLIYLIDGGLRGFDPKTVAEVDSVHGEILDIIRLTTLADHDDLTKTFYSECLLTVEVPPVT